MEKIDSDKFIEFLCALINSKKVQHVGGGMILYDEVGLLAFDNCQDLMNNTIEVMIGSFMQGLAIPEKILDDVINAADRVGLRLLILPEYAYINQDGFDTKELVKWLRLFGFKGRRERMLRMPLKEMSLKKDNVHIK